VDRDIVCRYVGPDLKEVMSEVMNRNNRAQDRRVEVQVQVILRPTASRPVGQSVLTSGPIWDPWPHFYY
jgi:hypothetical protein